MEIGDSFVINSETKANEIQKYLKKVYKIKLTKRFAGDWMGHANLWRLWRIE
jgi:translation initiation factor IF-3